MEVANASQEIMSIRAPGWDNFREVKPNTRFIGDFKVHRVEPLTPVKLNKNEPVVYPFGVHLAEEADIDGLTLLIPQILAETELLPVSPSKIEDLIERLVARKDGSICGVVRGPDGIDGSVGLVVCESDVSDEKFVQARWLGLHPSLRNNPPPKDDPRSHIGKRLFGFAKWYHAQLEQEARRPILLKLDLATKIDLGPKLGFYERNAPSVGAIFAFMTSEDATFLARQVEPV